LPGTCPPTEAGRYTGTERSQEWPRHWPPVGYITAVLRGYCAGASQNGTYQNPGKLREPAEVGG